VHRVTYESVEALLDTLAAAQQAARPVLGAGAGSSAGAATALRRMPMEKNADSLSGSPFEWVFVGGRRYAMKHISRDLDWLMRRVLGDGAGGRPPWALVMWRDGLLERCRRNWTTRSSGWPTTRRPGGSPR
jgi:hypothetical protein